MAKKGERVPWIKLYGDYASSRSHAELDDRALWTGVALMLLIRAGCDARDDRQPWALKQDGSPYSLAAIAREARQSAAVAKRGLGLLVEAGTVAVREDGAWGMPKFWEKQETDWARIKREQRQSRGQYVGQSKRKSTGKSKGRPPQEVRCSPSENEDTPPEGGSSESKVDPSVLAANRVLVALNGHLQRLGEPGKLTTTSWILAIVRGRPDGEAECLLVLEHMAAEAARTGDPQHLNPSTPFRPAHFETRLAKARASQRQKPQAQGRLHSFDDYERVTAEEDSRVR